MGKLSVIFTCPLYVADGFRADKEKEVSRPV